MYAASTIRSATETAPTSSISVNIRDLAPDDRGVEEALVLHAEALLGLVLLPLARLPRGRHCLERGRGDGVVRDAAMFQTSASQLKTRTLPL